MPFVSLLILFFRCILKEADGSNDEMVIIAGLTGMSIAQFTYFLGRSHPNNLFHISIPLIVIAACVIVYLSREASRGTAGFSLSFIYGGFFAMMMLSLNLSPAVFEKLGARFYEYSRINKHIQDFFERKPTNAKVAETLYLIDKYVKMDNRIAVFTAPDDASEALILSRKSNVYPVSHVIQDTEIGTLDPRTQHELLSALQEKKFPITGQSERSAGAMVRTEPVPCDFVMVAAGNVETIKDMHQALRSRIRE